MNMKRLLALILAAMLIAPVFVSCDKETPDTPDTPAVSDSGSDTETTPPEQTGLVLDKTDFGGAEIRMLGISEAYNYGYYQTSDIWLEADSSDPFENAIYKRVQDCLTKYNFGISYTSSAGPMEDVAGLVSGGLDQVDVVLSMWSGAWKSSKAGHLLDLKEFPTLNLKNEWWDQNANKELSISGRMFYTAGDFTTVDDRCTRALYFNKTLAAANNMASPYELVRQNGWTFEVFAQMCRDVARDVDGGGTVDEDDIVGFFGENGQFHYLMCGVNEHYVSLDNTGMPVYSFLADSEAVTKMETVAGLLIEDKVVFDINKIKNLGTFTNKFTFARSKFAAGKHLFTIGGAQVISEFADMEDEFGILPLPKWNADQTRYYHASSGPMVAVPNTKKDTADLGYMMEYFAYEGKETVTPTFKEKMLKRRYAQDPDSGDMLDIIYSTKLFDLGFVANWNNIQGVANSAISAGKIPKAAAYTRAAKAIPNLIQQDYEQFLLMGKE